MNDLSIHISRSTGDVSISLREKLEFAELATTLESTAAAPALAPVILNPVDLPRRFLDASGNPVDAGSAAHVITHFHTAGLMFDVRAPKK
ncbi:MAG: hypothetical protein ACREUF_15450, partial [Solimonas sp.]